jgi:hypothetical protein
MANHEDRPIRKTVDLLLAFSRKKDGEPNRKCIRVVIKDYHLDLSILEARLKILGGKWRIHKTVNSRDTKKARIWFLHKLIDTDIFDGCLDSLWRTALLQKENAIEKNFLLDIDTQNSDELTIALDLVPNEVKICIIKTPNGHHLITKSFDTRKICKLPYVTLIRDGYYFIKEIKNDN